MAKLILILAVFSAVLVLSSATRNVFCYFTNWSNGRKGNGKFTVDNIDPYLCTHLLYAFAEISSSDYSINIFNKDQNSLEFEKFLNLKQSNPNLKLLISIGGWNGKSQLYSQIAADPSKRSILVQNVINYLNQYGFDGLDFDWEYPNKDNSNPADKQNYNELLRELSETLRPANKLLTAAVYAVPPQVDNYYDIPIVSQYLDHINLMTYDLHGSWDHLLLHHAAVYQSSADPNPNLNVITCVSHWIQQGADPLKINLGLPTYGRTFTMSGSNSNLGAPASGAGLPGPYTQEGGMLGYNEICEVYNDWTYVWDEEILAPYSYSNDQWVGYDDPISMNFKGYLVRDWDLGGIMFWTLDTDDFAGRCGKGTYPLINAAKQAL